MANLGFVGLGVMGGQMVSRLMDQGHIVTGYNRTESKARWLIEKGMLKTYLLTRQPVRGYEGSNGHARLPGPYGANAATIGNLFVSSTDTVPAAELMARSIARLGRNC